MLPAKVSGQRHRQTIAKTSLMPQAIWL